MSAQLRSFEGPDVQLLLDQIRAELGPGAKIDGAEKFRVGGVMGFFAREHYRVVVEVPATPEEPAAPVRLQASPPASGVAADVFSAMAEATDDVNDVGAAPRSARTPAAATAATTTTPVAPERTPVDDEHALIGSDAIGSDAGAESFDAVLTRVATTLETAPAADANGSPTGNGSHTGNGSSTGRASSTGGGSSTSSAMADDGSAASSAPGPTTEDAVSAGPTDIASKASAFLAGTTPGSPIVTAAPDDPIAGALRLVGLDETAVHAVSEGLRRGGGLEALLFEALSGLTPPPAVPSRTGSLLVVVGAGDPARRLAAALAGEIGGDPSAVPFASLDTAAYTVATGSLLIRDAEAAAERAPGWRRSQAAVVAVDVPVTGGQRSWATHLIASLRPTAVWGIVDSTCKTEDIAAWAQTLGGIDALALENTDDTASPAAALGVGIPVARLDGQPANAARWVATIAPRIPPCM